MAREARYWLEVRALDGNANAMYSPEYTPPLTATTMYCLPSARYVIGDPLCGAGIHTAPTSAPVCLSYARSIAPRGRPGGAVTCASPMTTSVLVTIKPTPEVPGCPVLPMFFPASSG